MAAYQRAIFSGGGGSWRRIAEISAWQQLAAMASQYLMAGMAIWRNVAWRRGQRENISSEDVAGNIGEKALAWLS
jgi:hypothetical protein